MEERTINKLIGAGIVIIALMLMLFGAYNPTKERAMEVADVACAPYPDEPQLAPQENDIYSWGEWVARQGNPPSGSFEIRHTGANDAIEDVRFFVITDVLKEKDCVIAFEGNNPHPFGMTCE